MAYVKPSAKADRTVQGIVPEVPGERLRCVQVIYDYKVYQRRNGKFLVIRTDAAGTDLGEHPTQAAAVKAVMMAYAAQNGSARGANPLYKPLDRSRPLGYTAAKGTSR